MLGWLLSFLVKWCVKEEKCLTLYILMNLVLLWMSCLFVMLVLFQSLSRRHFDVKVSMHVEGMNFSVPIHFIYSFHVYLILRRFRTRFLQTGFQHLYSMYFWVNKV